MIWKSKILKSFSQLEWGTLTLTGSMGWFCEKQLYVILLPARYHLQDHPYENVKELPKSVPVTNKVPARQPKPWAGYRWRFNCTQNTAKMLFTPWQDMDDRFTDWSSCKRGKYPPPMWSLNLKTTMYVFDWPPRAPPPSLTLSWHLNKGWCNWKEGTLIGLSIPDLS